MKKLQKSKILLKIYNKYQQLLGTWQFPINDHSRWFYNLFSHFY